jgi:hypothetical protein
MICRIIIRTILYKAHERMPFHTSIKEHNFKILLTIFFVYFACCCPYSLTLFIFLYNKDSRIKEFGVAV